MGHQLHCFFMKSATLQAGGSLESIATAKAGIMKAGRPVVLGRQPHPKAKQVLCQRAAALDCRCAQSGPLHAITTDRAGCRRWHRLRHAVTLDLACQCWRLLECTWLIVTASLQASANLHGGHGMHDFTFLTIIDVTLLTNLTGRKTMFLSASLHDQGLNTGCISELPHQAPCHTAQGVRGTGRGVAAATGAAG